MNETLQEAIKEAYVLAPASKSILHTLEIRQEGVQDAIYIVRARRGIVATDENGHRHRFEPAGFEFSLPPSTEEGFQSLTIAIDNINRVASDFVNTAQEYDVPVKIIYRPYMSDDLSQPQMNPPLVLYLKEAQITDMQVTGRATFMDIVNKKFPSELYTRLRFPTLG